MGISIYIALYSHFVFILYSNFRFTCQLYARLVSRILVLDSSFQVHNLTSLTKFPFVSQLRDTRLEEADPSDL